MIKKMNIKKLKYIMMAGFLVVQNPYIVKAEESLVTVEDEDKDDVIIEYFSDIKDELTDETLLEKAKENIAKNFITITDFLIYDGEIKGITFDEIKESTKEEIYEIYDFITCKIDEKFPNARTEIGEKYDAAKEWISEKYDIYSPKVKDVFEEFKDNASEKIENFANEKLGEDLTNDIKDGLKDQFAQDKENLSNLYDSSKDAINKEKQKIKNWYSDLKNKYE